MWISDKDDMFNLLCSDCDFDDGDADDPEHVLDAVMLQGLNHNLKTLNLLGTHFLSISTIPHK